MEFMIKNNWKELAVGLLLATITAGLSLFVHIGAGVFSVILYILIGYIIVTQSGNGTVKSTLAKRVKQKVEPLSFNQVGGAEHVKEELKEALQFLTDKQTMAEYGIRVLKGILLTGPPGTGKTLLAKASANYTDSVFIAASGSEFVEKYVGTGANRVRGLFDRARSEAKKQGKRTAIIFIDEIDVIGGKRDGGQLREYDQTLNQLLTEMDGIYKDQEVQIFMMAATNRKDMLDEALLRPGRFDRHIEVSLPDRSSRAEILQIHAANKKVSPNVVWDDVARDTYQFSGAQLEAVMNEAAIYAYREQSTMIEQQHIQMAIDKVLLGEKINREATKEDKIRVARHELGHAIMAEETTPGSVAQVVLTPRGGALGFVRHTPSQDKYLYSKSELENKIMVTLGGAVAEQIYYGERSTGSRGDFDQALQIIQTMVESGLTSAGIIRGEQLDKLEWKRVTDEILNELLERTEKTSRKHEHTFEQVLPDILQNESVNGDNFRKYLKDIH